MLMTRYLGEDILQELAIQIENLQQVRLYSLAHCVQSDINRQSSQSKNRQKKNI